MKIERNDYELWKRQVSQEVDSVLEEIIVGLGLNLWDESKEFASKLLKKRKERSAKHGRLRDAIVSLTLNANGVKEITGDYLRVIAAGELYNMASYYQNWHLDDKNEVRTEFDKKLCHITSHIFREAAHSVIDNTNFPDKTKIRLQRELQESNTAIQYGQALELSGLTFEKKAHLQKHDVFVKNYIKRCYLFSGRFYGASFCMGPIMAGANEEDIKRYRLMGEFFGTAGQMVNDVGDFCLSKDTANCLEKDYQDQFADLEKGTITLPIWELAKYIDIGEYAGKVMDAKEKEESLSKLVENRCFDSTRLLTNHFRNAALSQLNKIAKNPFKGNQESLIKTFLTSNKFYVHLRESHRYDWNQKVYNPAITSFLESFNLDSVRIY